MISEVHSTDMAFKDGASWALPAANSVSGSVWRGSSLGGTTVGVG